MGENKIKYSGYNTLVKIFTLLKNKLENYITKPNIYAEEINTDTIVDNMSGWCQKLVGTLPHTITTTAAYFENHSVNSSTSYQYIIVPQNKKCFTRAKINNTWSEWEAILLSTDVYGCAQWDSTVAYAPLGNTDNKPSFCMNNGRMYQSLIATTNVQPAIGGGANWKWIKVSDLVNSISKIDGLKPGVIPVNPTDTSGLNIWIET